MRKLDRIDRMILDILQNEGRIAISELASRVSLSTTPCSERVKRLERDGIIMGYHARLNPKHLDRNLLVFLEISLSAKSGDVFEQVAACSQTHALGQISGIFRNRQYQYRQVGLATEQLWQSFSPCHRGHVQIQQHHVWAQLLNQFDAT